MESFFIPYKIIYFWLFSLLIFEIEVFMTINNKIVSMMNVNVLFNDGYKFFSFNEMRWRKKTTLEPPQQQYTLCLLQQLRQKRLRTAYTQLNATAKYRYKKKISTKMQQVSQGTKWWKSGCWAGAWLIGHMIFKILLAYIFIYYIICSLTLTIAHSYLRIISVCSLIFSFFRILFFYVVADNVSVH